MRALRYCGIILIGLGCICSARADYRYAPDALREMDLASDTDWTLSIDDGTPRAIKVTAGGWNSDQQTPQIPSADVKDHVVYERKITIPAEAKDQAVKVLFGGCNYGAEVFLDDKKIIEHIAPMTPFIADLTGVAKPGQTQVLRVKAYSRRHFGAPPMVPVGFDFNKGMVKQYDGLTKYAYGLTGHVRLAIYPPIHISEVFVRPSVSAKTLAYDVWISNAGKQDRDVVLKGSLVAWDKRDWSYPAIPEQKVSVPAGQTRQVTVADIPWNLGPESYWWPNIPFREDYKATLHWLKLTVEVEGKPTHEYRQRFGFVEHAEGPYYYTVNGVRHTAMSDCNSYGQVGEYDCWTETPCFQPPHGDFKGCPETWKRYQRIGFNSMRLSTSVPTRYMLETADEAGYLLIPEGGSWGNGSCSFDKTTFCFQMQETIRPCRNHPSVARYSLANESLPGNYDNLKTPCPWRWLIDAAVEMDPTRPYVFESNNNRTGEVLGMKSGHAHQMNHYLRPVPRAWSGIQVGWMNTSRTDAPSEDHIRGMGECAWTSEPSVFIGQALAMRLNDWAYFAPWSWVNYWPNFLEGMSKTRHPWQLCYRMDRQDGVDGWGSPIIQTVQWALHPYLVIDRGLLKMNPRIRENSKAAAIGWPYWTPVYSAGDKVERQIELFNGGLEGGSFTLNWSAHWDGPDGPLVAKGVAGPVKIEAGFHATQTVTFDAPRPESEKRTLCLVLESVKDGKVVCHDVHGRYTVTAHLAPAPSVEFVGQDDVTQGNWQGKYGQAGRVVADASKNGAAPSFPGVFMEHLSCVPLAKETTETRALAMNDRKRNVAYWFDSPYHNMGLDHLDFEMDLRDAPKKVSLYFMDWQARSKKVSVSIRTLDGRLLDQRNLADFRDGKYLTWKIQGLVRVEVDASSYGVPFCGLFLD